MQEYADATFFCGLSKVVGRPILLVNLLLGERDCLRFDHGSIRKNVTLVDDGRSVVVLAGESALNMVRTSASFGIQVNAVSGVAALGGLARNKPSAIRKGVEAARWAADKAVIVSCTTYIPPYFRIFYNVKKRL